MLGEQRHLTGRADDVIGGPSTASLQLSLCVVLNRNRNFAREHASVHEFKGSDRHETLWTLYCSLVAHAEMARHTGSRIGGQFQ